MDLDFAVAMCCHWRDSAVHNTIHFSYISNAKLVLSSGWSVSSGALQFVIRQLQQPGCSVCSSTCGRRLCLHRLHAAPAAQIRARGQGEGQVSGRELWPARPRPGIREPRGRGGEGRQSQSLAKPEGALRWRERGWSERKRPDLALAGPG